MMERTTYNKLAVSYRSVGNTMQEAIKYLENSLNIAIEIGDRNGDGRVYVNLGAVYQSLAKNQEAIKYHEKSIRIVIELGDKEGEMALGTVYDALGKYQEAIKYLEKGLSIAIELGDKKGEGAAYENLGLAYYSLLRNIPRGHKVSRQAPKHRHRYR